MRKPWTFTFVLRNPRTGEVEEKILVEDLGRNKTALRNNARIRRLWKRHVRQGGTVDGGAIQAFQAFKTFYGITDDQEAIDLINQHGHGPEWYDRWCQEHPH